MIKRSIILFWRRLSKNVAFTTLNVFGLTLGFTGFIAIMVYVVNEKSFDRFNKKADCIYRVNTDTKFGDNETSQAITAPAVAAALRFNYPEIENVVRLMPSQVQLKAGNLQTIREDKFAFCDSTIFQIFTLPMIYGDPKTALSSPNSVVLTESAANKYFGSSNVAGQTILLIDDNTPSLKTVTGIIRDIPSNSHFRFDVLGTMLDLSISSNQNFASLYPFTTYILLKPHADPLVLEKRFPQLLKLHLPIDELEKNGDYFRINVTPLSDIHLKSHRQREIGINGDQMTVNIFLVVAILILLISCVNCVNLSLSTASEKAKEVAVRKALGADRRTLFFQFISESGITMLGALLVSITAVTLLFKTSFFQEVTGMSNILSSDSLVPVALITCCAFLLAIICAAGYPAIMISGFNPKEVFHGKLFSGYRRQTFRNALIVGQFCISIFLLISTAVIYKQYMFIKTTDVGYDRNMVLMIKNTNIPGNKGLLLKQEAKKIKGVQDATLSSFVPTGTQRWINYFSYDDKSIEAQYWPVDEDYVNTMGMQLIEGRNFSPGFSTDSSAIIINETAAKQLGIARNPTKRTIYYGDGSKAYHIVGIVKDFNFNSLKETVTPVFLTMNTSFETSRQGGEPGILSVKISSGHLTTIIDQLKKTWKELAPGETFTFSFMNDQFDTLYRSEEHSGILVSIFSGVAILLGCLGLFGLCAISAGQRKKELSIRKVLGASVPSIAMLISRDFIMLVLIAAAISVPLSIIGMQYWLQNFAYHTSIGVAPVAGGVIVAFLIASFTVGLQAIKTALINPVINLRSE